jgi:hypothetical protein
LVSDIIRRVYFARLILVFVLKKYWKPGLGILRINFRFFHVKITPLAYLSTMPCMTLTKLTIPDVIRLYHHFE